jgi:hypothetical protein
VEGAGAAAIATPFAVTFDGSMLSL